ncbi:MAG: hypothetical protein AB1611_03170 [bacterium]
MTEELRLRIQSESNSAPIKEFNRSLDETGQRVEETRGKMHTLQGALSDAGNTLFSLKDAIMGVGAALGVWKLEQMIEGWVKLAAAQDQADRSLKAAMVANNRYSDEFYQNTLKQAESLQKLTGIEDDQIERGQKMLMMFDSIGNDQIPMATRVMVDLAAVMEGDVRSAALALGKAMEGQTESLRRSGIVIDEEVYKLRGASGVLEKEKFDTTKETSKDVINALKELQDTIDSLTLSEHDYAVKKLNEKYAEYRKLLGDIPELTKAFNLELDALNKTMQGGNGAFKDLHAGMSTFKTNLQETDKKLSKFNTDLQISSEKTADELLKEANALAEIDIDKYNKAIKLAKQKQEEIQRQWDQTIGHISSGLSDAIIDSLNGGRDAFKRFFQDIKDYFLKMVLDKVIGDNIKKGIDAAMNYMNSKQLSGGLSSFNLTLGSGNSTANSGSNWGSYLGMGMMGYDLYQQHKSGQLNAEKGAIQGAIIGTLIKPGWGTIIGAVGGGLFGEWSKNYNEKHPSIDLLYEVIDGQIKRIGQKWKDTPKNQELLNTIEITLQKQIDFYHRIALLTDSTAANIPIHLHGKTAFDIQRGTNINNLQNMIASYFDISKLVPGVKDAFEWLWNITFGDINLQNLSNMAMHGPFPHILPNVYGTFPQEMWNVLFGPEAEKDPQKRAAILNQWLSSQVGVKSNTYYEPGWDGGPDIPHEYGYIRPVSSFISAEDAQMWTAYFDQISAKFYEIQENIAQGIGNAFLESIDTSGFQGFGDSLERFMYEKVKAGLAQGFTNQVIDQIMMSSTGFVGAFGLLDQYIKGDGGTTLDTVTSAFIDAGGQLGTILETLKPIFETFDQSLKSVANALGLNTTAIQTNTSAILGPVNSLLMSLDTGPLAPVQSVAGLQSAYQQLLAGAIGNPQEFNPLSSFITGTLLPFYQAASADYAGVVAGVRQDILGIPWVAREKGEQMSAAAIGQEVGRAVAPMLLDLKESAQITINVVVDGQVIKSQVVNSLDDPAVVQKLRGRV